jgi:hypothetical protein
MARRWNDSDEVRKSLKLAAHPLVKGPVARASQPVELPLNAGNADFYLTSDGRLIALARKSSFARLRTVLLKSATVAGFVLLGAVCGVVVI